MPTEITQGSQGADNTQQTKRSYKPLISLLGCLYSALLIYFDYAVFFYDIRYTSRIRFAIVGAVVSVLVCILFLYTRKTPLTGFLGMLNVVLFFPLLLMDWGNWPLLIPAAIVTLFGFFACHINDTAKTIFGTIFLLMYILGGIAFYLLTSMFTVKTIDTIIAEEASPSGDFRYYMLDIKNKSSGKYAVYIQPNTLDKENGIFRLETTVKKMIRQVNKPAELSCEWNGDELLINGEVFFTESKHCKKDSGDTIYQLEGDNWKYTRFDLDYPISELISAIRSTIERQFGKKDEGTTASTAAETTVIAEKNSDDDEKNDSNDENELTSKTDTDND